MYAKTSVLPSRIAVVAFDGITPFHLSVPCLVFGEHHRGPEVPEFEVQVCSIEHGAIHTSAGFDIATPFGLAEVAAADIVIMPSWHPDGRPAPTELLDALRAAHAHGARIVGLCVGTFPVAEAGLLDGRTATTHWELAELLARRFPKVKVDPAVLYVDEGDVLTSAGVAAALDCCLYLLRQMAGAEATNRVGRHLVVAPHRQGGQAQFIERPLPVSRSDDRFADVLEWVTSHLDQTHDIERLAERALMSRRSFTRHFRQATGTSVKRWLLSQRLGYVQRMLEAGDLPVELIAQQAGFGSALSLRQHFRATFKTTPSEYRKLFREQPSMS